MAGYNNEIRRRGAVFHVQTQDLGPGARCIESLVYEAGRLLSSRKTYYTQWLADLHLQDRIRQMMEGQHQAISAEIAEGKFDHFLAAKGKQGPAEKS
jgi:hypothetical protein